MIARIINYLYPSECPSCSQKTDSFTEAPFCRSCWSGIKQYSGPACPLCSNPLASTSADICGECLKNPPPFSKAHCYALYEGVLAKALHRFKFGGIRRLHKPLSAFLLTFDLSEADALVPVPLSASGLRKRGFNQSLLLAGRLSHGKGVPVVVDGLIKIRDTLPQIGLTAPKRRANLRGAFAARESFGGMNLVLVDDVVTTGATAAECTRVLMGAGALSVRVAAVARASAL